MRLRTLRCRNYRRLRDVELEFPDGLIAVTGPNGAGKSTLLEAIAWCLYGHEAARTGKDLLRGSYAGVGEDAEVRLEFELDGQAYVVTRRLRGKSQQPDAQIEVDGALVVAPGANSAEAATRYVSRSLGMDRRGFHTTVVATQGDLAALADTKPGERKRLILGLLGVDEVDQAIAAARQRKREELAHLTGARDRAQRHRELERRRQEAHETVQRVRAERTALEQETDGRLKAWHVADNDAQAAEEARQAHRELRVRLEQLQRTLAAREEERTRLAGELQLLEVRRLELEHVRKQLAPYDGIDARLAAARQASDVWRRRHEAERERERVAQDVRRWAEILAQNGHKDPAAQERLHAARSQVERLGFEQADLEAHLRQASSQLERLDKEAAESRRQLHELERHGRDAPCPTCARPLADALDRFRAAQHQDEAGARETVRRLQEDQAAGRKRLAAVTHALTAARTEQAAAEARWGDVQSRLQRHVMAEQEHGRARAALETAERQLTVLVAPAVQENELAPLEAMGRERDGLRERAVRLEAELHRSAALRRDVEAVHANVRAVQEEIGQATRALGDRTYREGTAEAARRKAEAARNAHQESQKQLAVHRERESHLVALLDQSTKDLEALAAAPAEVVRLERRVRVGELLAADRGDQGLLPEFRAHLIGRIRPMLARMAGALVAQMTQGRYRDLEFDDEYTLSLFDGSAAWPLERFSGGERDVVHLALRLAVSELLARARRARRLSFVALDEVLASQDAHRRASVLDALKGLAPHFRQVLLVTHLDEVRDRVDHVIQVMPGPGGTSVVAPSWA